MLGIVNVPDPPPRRGVVFVVADGPQYRIGAQRQFVSLGRSIEAHGYAALRFDYRGMGDSEGHHRGFLHVDSDIRAAVDALIANVPTVEEVVLWGECDGVIPIAGLETLRVAVPDLAVERLPGLGHVPQVECPEAFVAALRRLLDRVGAVTSS